MDIDIDYNDIRGRSALSSKVGLRISSISSNTLLRPYHEHIVMNNNLLDIDIWKPINSFQLSYNRDIEIGKSVSKTADTNLPKEG